MGWNLPDGCTDEDIDRAAGAYDPCDHKRGAWSENEDVFYCPSCGLEELAPEPESDSTKSECYYA